MLRYNQLKVTLDYDFDEITKKLGKQLHIDDEKIKNLRILKESLDARKKPELFYSLSVAFSLDKENEFLKRNSKDHNLSNYVEKNVVIPECKKDLLNRPVIIGAGPAGLFCAYYLALAGCNPLIIERGKTVENRKKDVEDFFAGGSLNLSSNVQFGEGGAGTFSDGKLNTLNKDPFGYQKEVLRLFVKAGANPKIQYEQKPHLGTDCLIDIVKNLRTMIENLGGEFLFETTVTDFIFKNDHISGVKVNNDQIIDAEYVVLAIGHSSRDTFQKLYDSKVNMESKSFAIGYRVMHNQSTIDESQYGKENVHKLLPATYKLTHQASNNRGVYSFCMCPGGYVVNASSEKEKLCINGMSYSLRDSGIANSAIIISVNPEDYGSVHPLSGIEFQRKLEGKAYLLSNGNIPIQTYGDYKSNRKSLDIGKIKPAIKGAYSLSNLRDLLPIELEDAFIEGMESFGKKIKGFSDDDTILAGLEARTSSPVRINRNEMCESTSYKGLFPCGEGAGYAGGITSASMDGLKVAIAILEDINK